MAISERTKETCRYWTKQVRLVLDLILPVLIVLIAYSTDRSVTSAAFPHTGSGSAGGVGVWTNPSGITPDTYQLSALLEWSQGWTIWGHSTSLARPWPDPNSLNGASLPFVAQYSGLPTGFSWAGSSVVLARIPKPAYTYH